MKQSTVYADPANPDQRVYQLDKEVAFEAFMDMLNAFRGEAFQNDLGMDAPGAKPKHDISGQLQAIDGVGSVAFVSPNYIVFKHNGASWDDIDPEVERVLANSFGKIETVNIVNGQLS